jgi:hypothetical protein
MVTTQAACVADQHRQAGVRNAASDAVSLVRRFCGSSTDGPHTAPLTCAFSQELWYSAIAQAAGVTDDATGAAPVTQWDQSDNTR